MHIRSFCLIAVRYARASREFAGKRSLWMLDSDAPQANVRADSGAHAKARVDRAYFCGGHYSRPAFGAPTVSSRVTRGRASSWNGRRDVVFSNCRYLTI